MDPTLVFDRFLRHLLFAFSPHFVVVVVVVEERGQRQVLQEEREIYQARRRSISVRRREEHSFHDPSVGVRGVLSAIDVAVVNVGETYRGNTEGVDRRRGRDVGECHRLRLRATEAVGRGRRRRIHDSSEMQSGK